MANDLESAQIDLGLDFLGDSPKITALATKDGVFVTDLLGVTDKAYGATYEDLGIDFSSFSQFSTMEYDMAEAEKDF